jgi:hypothetical protein
MRKKRKTLGPSFIRALIPFSNEISCCFTLKPETSLTGVRKNPDLFLSLSRISWYNFPLIHGSSYSSSRIS